jgi:hypothetical protein
VTGSAFAPGWAIEAASVAAIIAPMNVRRILAAPPCFLACMIAKRRPLSMFRQPILGRQSHGQQARSAIALRKRFEWMRLN